MLLVAETANNTLLDVWGYGGGSHQRWTLVSLGGGLYRLQGVGSGRSINVTGNSGENDATVVLYDYNGGRNSKFYFSSPALRLLQYDLCKLRKSGRCCRHRAGRKDTAMETNRVNQSTMAVRCSIKQS
jgi:hypothetical protein